MTYNTYIVNLPKRTDRREHIIAQFIGRNEFSWTIVPAIEHSKGAYSLWLTFQSIVRKEAERGSDLFIMCEDDHCFTDTYSPELLHQCISQAQSIGADLLSGGYSWFCDVVQISEHLFWANLFNGTQFTVVFSQFYQAILDADFGEDVIIDIDLSRITESKLVIYPYISTQKEFGYSDVTAKNNEKGYVEGIFDNSLLLLDTLIKVRNFYFPKFFQNGI